MVDEVCKVFSFFEKSVGVGGWCVCIVDSVDDMNCNVVNVLFKILEELFKCGILIFVFYLFGWLLVII